jgi:restriction system protein
MAIPDYQALMLPLLRLAEDGNEHRIKDAVDALASEFRLSAQDVNTVYPQSGAPVFGGRVRWADVYLTQAGLLQHVVRGRFRITEKGKTVLASNTKEIDVKYLERFPEFRDFRKRSRSKNDEKIDVQVDSQPPQEVMESAYQAWRNGLAQQLLHRVQEASPKFFERLVVDLLVAMGYGGSRQDAGRVTGRSGDEGIDGLINEDRLGLDAIYVQAKRWQGPVSRKEVQSFAGALDGQRASKGVMITTS